jgi:hypothetical protein
MREYYGGLLISEVEGASGLDWITNYCSQLPEVWSLGVKENLPEGVDGMAAGLHNLVSLLQTQRRRTKRCRVVEVGAVT